MSEGKLVSIETLEQQISNLEEVSITVRAPRDTLVPEYPYSRKAAGNVSVKEWIDTRLSPIIPNYEVSVINGYGENPHGRTNMDTIRNSYRR